MQPLNFYPSPGNDKEREQMKRTSKDGQSGTARRARPVDVHVGERLRQRRLQVGLSQGALAHKAGVNFQQIQKYENGHNRISASRLWNITKALDVPVSYFFKGLNPSDKRGSDDLFARHETFALLTAWYGMPESQRKLLLELVKDMAQMTDLAGAN